MFQGRNRLRRYDFAWNTTPKSNAPTTTEDIVLFTPGKPVSLEVPDQLFGSSFTLVTNLSNTIGDYMVVSIFSNC